MKTTIIAIAALLAGQFAAAQPDYYTGKDTVRGKNVTYLVEVWRSEFTVKNINNPVENEFVQPDGSPIPTDNRITWTRADSRVPIYRAFEETFTPEEIEDCKSTNEKFWVHMLISHDGSVIQVRFTLPKTPKMLAIPPDKLFVLETKLKQYVTATMRPETKKRCKYGLSIDALIFREIGMQPLPRQKM